ncbi:MAG: hypothetical protein HW384_425 [Dehalococcoidia bacterium]|nr:hypothetical protein [Dehalococcoidia bacterium]
MESTPEGEQFERLPLRLAWCFLTDRGLGNKADEIRNSKDTLGSYYTTLKRARVVTLLQENKILDQFVQQVWPFGNTQEGEKQIERLRRIYDK